MSGPGYTRPVGERSGVTIRVAKPSDAAALEALQRSIYLEGVAFVGDGPPAVAVMERRLRFADPTAALDLVAVRRGNDVVGWLELNRHGPSRLHHVAVLTLAVVREARRQGVGRDLLRHAYDWCRRVGVRKISLDVRAGNAAAVALYHAEGFEVEGRERGQVKVADGFEDNLIMAKWLS